MARQEEVCMPVVEKLRYVQSYGYTEGGMSGWAGEGVAALEKLLYITDMWLYRRRSGVLEKLLYIWKV